MNLEAHIDLSVIIVNYNVSNLVLEAVASLQGQKFAASNGDAGRLEIIVVDNASSPEDIARLQGLPSGVVLVRNERNAGFAAANNRGMERASGRYLCLLNPDTKALDGALETMLQHLYRHPEVGAVGPRIWADDERIILLPPGDPPTLSFVLSQIIGVLSLTWGKAFACRWNGYALTFWRSQVPIDVPMLSGACIVTSRRVVDRIGGFDPRYFLYYEDADWCRRVRDAGYRLVVVPDAQIVHYYNQSAKSDPMRSYGHLFRSQVRFVETHYGRIGLWLHRAMRAMGNRVLYRQKSAEPRGIVDLGYCAEPPLLSVSSDVSSCEVMVQFSHNCHFISSAAAFIRTAEFRLSPPVWGRMQPGRYYARMVDPETLRPLAVWSWEKG